MQLRAYRTVLVLLMLTNAAATFSANHGTWAAGVLAATNAVNALLLIVGLRDLLRGPRS